MEGSLQRLFDLVPIAWQSILQGKEVLLDGIDSYISRHEHNPRRELIFNALQLDPLDVRVVIIGQDPYPKKEHAMGLAFSVPEQINPYPPTLKNIISECVEDVGADFSSGDLTHWRNSGVLLLNSSLTCQSEISLSHQKISWNEITEAILVGCVRDTTVGILWGNHAKKFASLFDSKHVLSSAHPSPLSAYRGFFGSKPFSRTNEILRKDGIDPIIWSQQNVQ